MPNGSHERRSHATPSAHVTALSVLVGLMFVVSESLAQTQTAKTATEVHCSKKRDRDPPRLEHRHQGATGRAPGHRRRLLQKIIDGRPYRAEGRAGQQEDHSSATYSKIKSLVIAEQAKK